MMLNLFLFYKLYRNAMANAMNYSRPPSYRSHVSDPPLTFDGHSATGNGAGSQPQTDSAATEQRISNPNNSSNVSHNPTENQHQIVEVHTSAGMERTGNGSDQQLCHQEQETQTQQQIPTSKSNQQQHHSRCKHHRKSG